MAQQFNITQSLFGFTPTDVQRQLEQQQQQRDLALAQNPVAGYGAMGLQSLRRGTQTLQQGLFGVEPPEMAQANAIERAKQAALPALQSGGQLAYLDALAGEFERMGLTNQAVQARMLADQQRATQAEQQSQIALRQAQAQKATKEQQPKLSERLVDLETKKATTGLTAQEAAELTALQKVVKLQSPKGVDLSGLASVLGQKATEEEAKALGKDLGTIQGKQQSVESLRSARSILDQGIFSGSYAEFQSELAKKTLGTIGNLKRVENTEVFINEVSSNVIPLLQEFGGNDSNEELRFLQRLVGGDITLQESSIRRILDNAIRKIERGIERTAAKGQAVREGRMPELPTAAPKPTQTRTTKSGVTYQIIED